MKYGNYDNVTKDSKILKEILDRQGSALLLEIIAEHIGNTSVKYSLSHEDNLRAMNSLLKELKESILERI